MYDAQQGSTSGAHIDMSTASGTNNIHGSAYVHRGTNWLNADPYFFNADPNIPSSEKNPQLHRYSAGGNHRIADQERQALLLRKLPVHARLRPGNRHLARIRAVWDWVRASPVADRSGACLAQVANANSFLFQRIRPVNNSGTIGTGPGDINPIAYALFNYKLPNGQFMIPSANPNAVVANPSAFSSDPSVQSALIEAFPEDAEVPGTALFLAHQAVANLDWNPNSSHSFSVKYYYQHDPTIAPFAYSQVAGFAQHLDAGSQVIALSHTQIVKSNLSITEIFGFIREKAYSTMDQPFTPQQFATFAATPSRSGQRHYVWRNHRRRFADSQFERFGHFSWHQHCRRRANIPILSIQHDDRGRRGGSRRVYGRFPEPLQSLGQRHLDAGQAHDYLRRQFRIYTNEYARTEKPDGNDCVPGLHSASCKAQLIDNYLYNITATINGNANRYWRANETGEYIQDKFQLRSNLTITAGVRFDWNGGLKEKNGNLLNFRSVEVFLRSHDGHAYVKRLDHRRK